MTLFTADAAVRNPGRDEAVEFLMRDRAWSAYALGYLDPTAGVPTSVLAAGSEGEPESILVQAQLPQLLSIFASGRPEGIASAIEALPASPASGVFSIRGEAVSAFERHLNVSTAHQMRRMVVRQGQLRPRRAGQLLTQLKARGNATLSQQGDIRITDVVPERPQVYSSFGG
jgi:hypothetical protein